ncbi:MAG: thioredoxin fold domain-containing protein [candidate division Zixibacteria bacterium]|nr:thioredoxin fold domain-containing protein [candidate division Zixibacteria bacterium]
MGFLKNLFFKPPKPGKPLPITNESFQKEVLESEVPVVVDFWSPRCPPCQVMGGLLDEIGPDYAGRVKILKLNVEQNPETAMQYRVQGVPTVIFFRKGRPVDRIVGLLPLNPLRAKLDALARSNP